MSIVKVRYLFVITIHIALGTQIYSPTVFTMLCCLCNKIFHIDFPNTFGIKTGVYITDIRDVSYFFTKQEATILR